MPLFKRSSNQDFEQALFGNHYYQMNHLLESNSVSMISHAAFVKGVTTLSEETLNVLLTLPLTEKSFLAENQQENFNIFFDAGKAAIRAIKMRRLDILEKLLSIPVVLEVVKTHAHHILCSAVEIGDVATVNRLLEIEAMQKEVAAKENAALCLAAEKGFAFIMKRFLTFEAVQNNVAANTNAAFRATLNNFHLESYRLLKDLPQVKASRSFGQKLGEIRLWFYDKGMWLKQKLWLGSLLFVKHIFGINTNKLTRNIFNHENAMEALSPFHIWLIYQIRTKYRQQYREFTEVSILSELKAYLIKQYKMFPATDGKQVLPMQYDPQFSQSKKLKYNQNIFHAAYRYLFCHPNFWIDPDAAYTKIYFHNFKSADIPHEALSVIAMIWLYVSDEANQNALGIDTNDAKVLFIRVLFELARAHNWDSNRVEGGEYDQEFDDNGLDKPSCTIGIMSRLADFLTLMYTTSEKPLSELMIKRRFREYIVAEREDNLGLFNYINTLDSKALNELDEAIASLVVVNIGNFEALTPEEKQRLEPLKPKPQQVEAFIEQCKQEFGQKVITKEGKRLRYADQNFSKYTDLIQHFSENALCIFASELKRKVEERKELLTPKTFSLFFSFCDKVVYPVWDKVPHLSLQEYLPRRMRFW